MANELTSFNAKIEHSDTEEGTYVELGKARLIKPADWTKGTVNVRGLTDMYPERLQGWIDYDSPMQLEFYLSKAMIATLQTMFKTQPGAGNRWWKITFQQLGTESSPSVLSGQGFLKKIGWAQMEEADNLAVILPCEIEQSGEWDFDGGTDTPPP